ncbi:hypothetical protein [Bacteroides sp. 3_1_23]|nr:hypothetical protein [Bacteroides sp. 3_1_23]
MGESKSAINKKDAQATDYKPMSCASVTTSSILHILRHRIGQTTD